MNMANITFPNYYQYYYPIPRHRTYYYRLIDKIDTLKGPTLDDETAEALFFALDFPDTLFYLTSNIMLLFQGKLNPAFVNNIVAYFLVIIFSSYFGYLQLSTDVTIIKFDYDQRA